MRIIILCTLVFLKISLNEVRGFHMSNDDPVRTYIDKYKEIALSEMQRTGIPASIKLAQGILESNSGRSTLAQKANNHFGIKCGKQWTDETFYREDDDYKDGKLIESCFRKYTDGAYSFIAHSEFLTNPRSKYRYGFLFQLDPLNYSEWARGLKKSGYATDPKYADKLISIIESYELYLFDEVQMISYPEEEMIALSEPKTVTPDESKPLRDQRTRVTSFDVRNGEHLVLKGETMKNIADQYNIDLDLFYFQNRMPNGSQPKTGEKLKIEGYFHWGKKPRLEPEKNEEGKMLFTDESMTITME